MFYIKHPLTTDPEVTAELRVEITYDNVYTTCPQCGKEFNLDLLDLAKFIPHFDWDDSIFCKECSAKRHAEQEQP